MKNIIKTIRHYGIKNTWYKALERLTVERVLYRPLEANEISEAEKVEQEKQFFEYQPKFSILVPTYETNRFFLEQLLESVQNQTYSNWELCIADASATSKVEKLIDSYRQDKRIVYRRLDSNAGIAENTNQAFKLAGGDYIGLLDHDDTLAVNALYEVVKALNENPEIDFIYTDEDKMDEEGKIYYYPHIKPDYNREYLRTNNYICHFVVVQRKLAESAGGWRKEFDGAQDYDFVLRCTEIAKNIYHIPKILYHWRVHNNSTAANKYSKLYAYESGKRAIEEHLKRTGESAEVTILGDLGTYKVEYLSESGKQYKLVSPEELKQDNVVRLKQQGLSYLVVIDKEVRYICDRNGGRVHITDREGVRNLLESQVFGFFQRETVALVAAKTVSRGKIVQNGIMTNRQGEKEILFHGLNCNFRGYFKRAVLPLDVDGIIWDFAVINISRIKDVDRNSWAEETIFEKIKEQGLEMIQISDLVVEKR